MSRQLYAMAFLLGRVKWAAEALESGVVPVRVVAKELEATHRAGCDEMDAEVHPNTQRSDGDVK